MTVRFLKERLVKPKDEERDIIRPYGKKQENCILHLFRRKNVSVHVVSIIDEVKRLLRFTALWLYFVLDKPAKMPVEAGTQLGI